MPTRLSADQQARLAGCRPGPERRQEGTDEEGKAEMSARKRAREMEAKAQRDLKNARRRQRRAMRQLEERAEWRDRLTEERAGDALERFRDVLLPFVEVRFGARPASEGPVIGSVEDPALRAQ